MVFTNSGYHIPPKPTDKTHDQYQHVFIYSEETIIKHSYPNIDDVAFGIVNSPDESEAKKKQTKNATWLFSSNRATIILNMWQPSTIVHIENDDIYNALSPILL